MRGYKTLIQEAELLAMPPAAVAAFLERRAVMSREEARDDTVDEDAEKSLRGLGDPLIDLALARYGRHMEVAAELFRTSEPGSPIRLACLSNRALGHEIFRSFPAGLIGRGNEPMVQWLPTASDTELLALFENPALDDSFLRDLLERSREWAAIDEAKLRRIVSILQRNPRMRAHRQDDWMDGYDEYSYNSVFDAAWKLAETAQPTPAWAACLGWLYEQLQPSAFSIKDPLTLAQRWRVADDDVDALDRQKKDHQIGQLGDMERVRKGLARLALRNRKILLDLLNSDDIAFRAAAYAAGDVSAEQLLAGYEKDAELVFAEAISNRFLWMRQLTRKALHDIAWDVVRNDKNSDLSAANRFNAMAKHMREKYPAWFADDEAEELSGHGGVDEISPVTKADLSAITTHLDRQSQGLDTIAQGLRDLMGRSGWIWWFAFGALVANILHQ